jgi:hypothetical protein
MFIGRPKELAQNTELLTQVNRILSARRLDAFAAASGVELRELPEGCIAGFDYGTVYLARVGAAVPMVRKRFEERLISDAVVRTTRPDLWRITGLVANTPESLLTVDNDFIAVAVGDPLLVRVAEAFTTGRFKKSKPALSGAALTSLPADLSQAPLRFYAPGPFTGEWASAADGVLARALAFGAAVTLPSPSVLQVRLVLSGAFGPDLEKTRSRLEATWSNLQASTIGHVLHLQEALAPARITVRDDTATLDVAYPVSTLIQGISAAVIDNIGQILGNLPSEGDVPPQPGLR